MPIGLDMGPDRLNLAQMDRVGGKPALSAIASIPYPCPRDELLQQPNEFRLLLRRAWQAQPFRGRNVVSCLPAGQIKIISLNYRHVEGQSDDQAIITELRARLQGELDSLVVDFMPLRQEDADSGTRDALVAMAPREQVLAYLNLLTAAGLQVDALDIGPAALARLLKHTVACRYPEFPATPNALLINFGADTSYLTVIWGRRMYLDRAVEFGESRLFDRLKAVLDVPPEQASQLLYQSDRALSLQSSGPDEERQLVAEVLRPELALLLQEVSKTLVYMASRTRGKSVDAVFLAGPVARYADVMNGLKQQLKVPVDVLNPVEDFPAEQKRCIDAATGTQSGMALTAGLALRGMPEHE
jgi:type IV pilus assembly protein PilM